MDCQAIGSTFQGQHLAVERFCHPAHLMESLHTYNPATHIVLSREAGEIALDCVGMMDKNDDEIADTLDEFRAALEVGE